MEVRYSSTSDEEFLYTEVKIEDEGIRPGMVTVGGWIPYDDSRRACREATREQAVKTLERALSALRNEGPQ